MKKRAGIWLDGRKAFLVNLSESETKTFILDSGIEEFNPKGGWRSKQPWGPMDKMVERKFLERKKHQTKKYFGQIKTALGDVEQLLILGPGVVKKELEKFIKSDDTFNPEILAVLPEDLLTDNQIVAKIKEWFETADSG